MRGLHTEWKGGKNASQKRRKLVNFGATRRGAHYPSRLFSWGLVAFCLQRRLPAAEAHSEAALQLSVIFIRLSRSWLLNCLGCKEWEWRGEGKKSWFKKKKSWYFLRLQWLQWLQWFQTKPITFVKAIFWRERRRRTRARAVYNTNTHRPIISPDSYTIENTKKKVIVYICKKVYMGTWERFQPQHFPLLQGVEMLFLFDSYRSYIVQVGLIN